MVSQREAEPVALRYFAEGLDAFVLDYDVAPKHYPTQLLQAGMAMLYLRREAGSLYIDDEHIAAIGFSAGGHLCGCISLLWDDPALVQAFGKEECVRIRPDASVLSYPVVTFGEWHSHGGSFENFCGDAVKKEDYSLEKKCVPPRRPALFGQTQPTRRSRPKTPCCCTALCAGRVSLPNCTFSSRAGTVCRCATARWSRRKSMTPFARTFRIGSSCRSSFCARMVFPRSRSGDAALHNKRQTLFLCLPFILQGTFWVG